MPTLLITPPIVGYVERNSKTVLRWGNTIANNRDFNLNSTFDLVRLYNHIPFLKKANERFNREPNTAELSRKREERQAEQRRKAQERKAMEARMKGKGVTPDGQKIDNNEALAQQQRNELPKNRNSFEQEITLTARLYPHHQP